MATKKAKRKIIWAIDALLTERTAQDHVIAAIRALSKPLQVTVLPTYVLSPDQLNLSIELTGPWVKTFKPAAERSLQSEAQRSGLTPIGPPKVLVEDIPSLKRSARALSAYAASQGAELIVVSSHGRGGISRAVLGSFAETLLLHSRVPVLIVGPETQPHSEVKRILFATDLSTASLGVFNRVVDLAKEMGAKVTLMHAILNPIQPVLQSGVYLLGGGWVPVPIYVEKEAEKRLKKLESIAEKSRKKGVDVSTRVETDQPGTAQAIFHAAEKVGADWIALAAESGPMTAALLGSITRQVVRGSRFPVWVLRGGKKG